MIVISDSSPLITLVHIPTKVYNEVVIGGSGLAGAIQVANAPWIQVIPVRDTVGLNAAMEKTGLGPGEVAAVQLARELNAQVVLMDEWRGRRYAEEADLIVFGCIGIVSHRCQDHGGELAEVRPETDLISYWTH